MCNRQKRLIRAAFWLLLHASNVYERLKTNGIATKIMAFITAQNTLSTFLTFWHLFHVQGVKFSCQVSRRKIYDVNLVLALLRRKIYQRLFYGEKSIIVQCTLKVVLKPSNISRRHIYDVIIFSMTRYVVIIISTWNYDVNEEVRVTT